MYVHGSPSDRVPYGGSTRDNSPWWISRIVGTQSIREDQHDINIPVATHGHPHSWHHKHSQTYICSTCSSYSLRWYHSNSHRIRSVPMLWCPLIKQIFSFLSFSSILSPLRTSPATFRWVLYPQNPNMTTIQMTAIWLILSILQSPVKFHFRQTVTAVLPSIAVTFQNSIMSPWSRCNFL